MALVGVAAAAVVEVDASEVWGVVADEYSARCLSPLVRRAVPAVAGRCLLVVSPLRCRWMALESSAPCRAPPECAA